MSARGDGRVLVAGVGNIFCSDDGFGVEVAARLAARPLPEGVEAADFGIRGVHLAYQLLDGYCGLVLVDAVDLHDAPGTVALIDLTGTDPTAGRDGEVAVDAHSMDPASVLATLAGLGGHLERVLLVGCQPGRVTDGIGLSSPVTAAVTPAAELAVRAAQGILEQMEVLS